MTKKDLIYLFDTSKIRSFRRLISNILEASKFKSGCKSSAHCNNIVANENLLNTYFYNDFINDWQKLIFVKVINDS